MSEILINKEAQTEIAKTVLALAEKGEFDLFQGVDVIVENAVEQAMAVAEKLINEYKELNDVEMAKLVKGYEPAEKVSDTPMMDTMRHSLAVKNGDFKLAEELAIKTTANSGTTTDGGYLAPAEDAYQLIDLVFKDSAMGAFGRKVPMKSNSLVIPTATTGTSVYTFTEATTTGSGGHTDAPIVTSFITLTAYAHGIWTTVTSQLLEDSDPKIEAFIRSDMTRQMGAAWDWGIFHGNNTVGLSGTNSLISGLEGDDIITTNLESAGGAVDFDDIMTLKACQDFTNSPLTLVAHPKAERQLATVKDNSGRYIYDPTVRSAGVPTIWNMPLVLTNQISTTLGGGSETAIFGGAFNDSMIVGIKPTVEFLVDPFTYANNQQIRFFMFLRLAMQVANESHFSMLNGITV